MSSNSPIAIVFRLPVVLAAFAWLASSTAYAAPQSFDFKDAKGVNAIQFSLDAPLEAINGTGNGVSGTVMFDPAAPAATTGKIVLDTNTLTVMNAMMLDHIKGAKWLDVAQFPTIVFEATKLDNVRTQGAQILADLTGTLTVKGITKTLTVPVSFTYLADKLSARNGDKGPKGDLLVLRTTFAINRSDFNIMAGQAAEKVSESIQITLALAGACPRK